MKHSVDSQAWQDKVLRNLKRGGPVCQHTAQYILDNNVEIGFARQSTSARWTLREKIELNPKLYSLETEPDSPTDAVYPQLLGTTIHEATHLEQGVALALSVEGEVGGWKAEYNARAELGDPITDSHWKAVALIPDFPTDAVYPPDQDLRRARSEMLKMAGWGYLIWLLPLRPNFWTRLVATFQRIVWGKGERA